MWRVVRSWVLVGDEVMFRHAGDDFGDRRLGAHAAEPGEGLGHGPPRAQATESTSVSAARSQSVNASLLSWRPSSRRRSTGSPPVRQSCRACSMHEAAGIASLIGGLALVYPDDAERLERGASVFEGLYAYISSGARSRPTD
jgi:hypothetical protein